ncbi:hypothetical protein KBC54_00900 [Patescibacteria group bacterium]|nr:hypothetical protein [Patescibacteria group bacterium]
MNGKNEGNKGQNRTARSNVVVLCGVAGCCPEIEKMPDGTFEIRDDDDGKVKLTADQYRALQDAKFA